MAGDCPNPVPPCTADVDPGPSPCLYGVMSQRGKLDAGVVAPGFLFDGEFRGEGELHVYGEFQGEETRIGTLRVYAGGSVSAPRSIHAERVWVAGSVKGRVDATGKVMVREGGVIHGDVRAPRFGLSSGGRVEGRVFAPAEPESRGGRE